MLFLKIALNLFAFTIPPTCQLKGEPKTFPLFLATPGFEAFAKNTKVVPAELEQSLLSFSPHLILEAILELEQKLAFHCTKKEWPQEFAILLKKAYLKKLGFKDVQAQNADALFRGFLTIAEDIEPLQKRLKPFAEQIAEKVHVKAVYGGAQWIQGVAVVGVGRNEIKNLEILLKKVCPASNCLFWDSRSLYKVLLTHEKGVAAFLPDHATLVLSDSLLSEPNSLSQIILLHELVHVASYGKKTFEGKDWNKEFQEFSGWNTNTWVAKGKGRTVDRPTNKILPNPLILPSRTHDGFIWEKTYQETKERKDIGEDLADHVAVFFIEPELYCFDKKLIAPQKFKWIEKTFETTPKKLSCL